MPTTLDQLRSIGPMLRSYKWDLKFIKMPPGSPITGDAREVHLRCSSTTLPTWTNDVINVNLHGHTIPVHGITNKSGTISFSLIETIDMRISKFINYLEQLVWKNNTGVQEDMEDGGSGDHSFDFTMTHLDNQDTGLPGYKVKRCFIQSVTRPDLNSESQVWSPSITVQYTDWEYIG